MKKIIDIVLSPYDKTNPKDMWRIILIDILTLGIGFVMLIHAFAQGTYKSEDNAILGASIFIIGILIKTWRMEYRK